MNYHGSQTQLGEWRRFARTYQACDHWTLDERKWELSQKRRGRRNGEPSYWFCTLNFSLLLMWWMIRLWHVKQRYIWRNAEHACSCFGCRGATRRNSGNRYEARSIQERRESARADSV